MKKELYAITRLNPSASDKAKIDELAQKLNQAEAGAARDRVLADIARDYADNPALGFAAIMEAERQRLRARETLPALTLLDYGEGDYVVTLNDYGGPDGDDVMSIQRFDTKEEAEAFISECRAHKDRDAEQFANDGDDSSPWDE